MGGGLVATVDDQATASTRVDKLLSLVQMLGAFGGDTGMSITTKEADHNGTKVTTITIAGDATTPPIDHPGRHSQRQAVHRPG